MRPAAHWHGGASSESWRPSARLASAVQLDRPRPTGTTGVKKNVLRQSVRIFIQMRTKIALIGVCPRHAMRRSLRLNPWNLAKLTGHAVTDSIHASARSKRRKPGERTRRNEKKGTA